MELNTLASATPTDDTAMTLDQVLTERGYSAAEIEARSSRLLTKQWKSSFFEMIEDDD